MKKKVATLNETLPTKALPDWPTLGSGEPHDFNVFSVQRVDRRSPRTGRVGSYRVIHAPDWVNVVALTSDRNLVLVEQYRHGLDRVTLEVPGGMVDPGESSADAAARELAEETGYVGSAPEPIGLVHPNPAIQTNRCTSWLIEDARHEHEPRPDEGEHIQVVEVPLRDIEEHVRRGAITHSLVICAFYWLRLHG
ncbi:MAG: NUDIX hydrolase [Thermoanaerobaculia bacterium]|nr:NUDIX hydrolase [Thermoanaerobaculia bacterium]